MLFAIFYVIGAWLGTNFYPDMSDYIEGDGGSGYSTASYNYSPSGAYSSSGTSLAEDLLDYPVPAYAAYRSPRSLYKTAEEKRLELLGLVNVREYVTDIIVRSVYATYRNGLGVKLYDYSDVYLRASAALKLANAQEVLRSTNRNLSLVIYDAARPQHVQEKCWEFAKIKGLQSLFTPPEQISMHSYGVAVDVGLIDLTTYEELDMGCPVDMPGKLAAIRFEDDMVTRGILTSRQLYNRLLLRNVMRAAGFIPIANEWWHFDAFSRFYAYENFTPIP